MDSEQAPEQSHGGEAVLDITVQEQMARTEEGAKNPRVVVISGPTACGKTELSIMLARLLGGEVVSADSMQVYRGMDIGTAKATAEQREAVPHHLVDIRDLDEDFNVVDYYYEAHEAIKNILARDRVPIVVGGSGYYLRTLIYGPPSGPSSVSEIREDLEEEMQIRGIEELYRQLQEVDPAYAEKITARDRQKVIRALEIIRLTGRKVSEHVAERHPRGMPNYDYRCWFLHRPREVIYQRIEERCNQMVKHGLVDEVQRLMGTGLLDNLSASQAIGYRQALDYLRSSQSPKDYDSFLSRFKIASRRYAKRQFTWFRSEPLFRWLDVEMHDPEIAVDMMAQDFLSF